MVTAVTLTLKKQSSQGHWHALPAMYTALDKEKHDKLLKQNRSEPEWMSVEQSAAREQATAQIFVSHYFVLGFSFFFFIICKKQELHQFLDGPKIK